MAEWDPTEAAVGDASSTDNSKSGIRAAWDAWSSRPENNAALLQFGLAMLQPRAPGQSAVGQFANAVGQGAEASQRNVAEQEARSARDFDQGIKSREAGARETTAQAYADQVRQGGAAKSNLTGALRAQAEFRKWLAKPEDTSGLSVDPIVGAISKQFPGIKSKADLLGNPSAMSAAQRLFSAQVQPPEGGESEPASAPPASPQPPATTGAKPQGRIVYDKAGKPYTWDGVTGHQPVPMGQ